MDKLSISGLKLTARIGSLDWEQHVLQTLHCDIVFQTDAANIAQTDQLDNAIDYDKLANAVQTFVTEHHFQLIETLADKLAHYLLTTFHTKWISLTLFKPGALKQAKDVAITIERSQV